MKLLPRRSSLLASVLVVVSLLIAGTAGNADAGKGGKAKVGKVEKKFGGQILTSDKKFPSSAKSEADYIAKLKKQKKAQFWEDKDNKQWKVHFAAFFKKKLTDIEYTVRLYDISGGRVLLSSFEQFMDSPDQTSIISYLILERKAFGVNKQIQMVIESRGRVVATGKFKILGEAEKFTGKADFSEEEANGGEE